MWRGWLAIHDFYLWRVSKAFSGLIVAFAFGADNPGGPCVSLLSLPWLHDNSLSSWKGRSLCGQKGLWVSSFAPEFWHCWFKPLGLGHRREAGLLKGNSVALVVATSPQMFLVGLLLLLPHYFLPSFFLKPSFTLNQQIYPLNIQKSLVNIQCSYIILEEVHIHGCWKNKYI